MYKIRNGEITYLVRRKISNCAVNAYVKLRPTKPGSMVSRDKTENIAVNKIIKLAHDSSLRNDKNESRIISLILLIHIFILCLTYYLFICLTDKTTMMLKQFQDNSTFDYLQFFGRCLL